MSFIDWNKKNNPNSVKSSVPSASGFTAYNRATNPKSAYQTITYKPQETKWYKGDAPTASEFEAQIVKIGQTDDARGRELYSLYESALSDPTSPIYNPYKKATSRAASELNAMGFDTSDKNFVENNAWLKGHYRLGTSGSPLAPSNSSTAEQNAAYWYNQYMEDEATTQKAEQEWAALQEVVGYWAGRKDRNYSDDEILAKINWSNFPTLKKMDAARQEGLSVGLTRPVGYSQDALIGVIYGSRNGFEGAPETNAVRAAYYGSGYTKNQDISNRLNPASAIYNPYAVGSTIDDAAVYYGVDSFDKDWLDKNRDSIDGGDETAMGYYNDVYKAEQTTVKAEEEKARLDEYIDTLLEYGNYNADDIIESIYDDFSEDYPTLAKMDESLKNGGKLMGTTRAIEYSRNDVENYVRELCKNEASKPTADETVQNLFETYGRLANNVYNDAKLKATDQETPVKAVTPENKNLTAKVVANNGTPAEKKAVKYGTNVDALNRARNFRENFTTNSMGRALYEEAENYYAENGATEYAFAKLYKPGDWESELAFVDEQLAQIRGVGDSDAPFFAREGFTEYAQGPLTQNGTLNVDRIGLLAHWPEELKEEALELAYYEGAGKGADQKDWYAFEQRCKNAQISEEEINRYKTALNDVVTFYGENKGYETETEIGKMFEPNPYGTYDTLNVHDIYEFASTERSEWAKQLIARREAIATQIAINPQAKIYYDRWYNNNRYDFAGRYYTPPEGGVFANNKDETQYIGDVINHKIPERHYNQTYQEVRRQAEEKGYPETYTKIYMEAALQEFNYGIEANTKALEDITSGKLKGYDQEDIAKIEEEIEYLKREKYSAEMYLLTFNDDFEEVVKKVKADFQGANQLDDNSLILVAIATQEIFGRVTSEETDIMFYLNAKYGYEEAQKYMDYLSDDNHGVIEPRARVAGEEAWENFAESLPVTATVATVIMSPAQVIGGAYALGGMVFGYEVDPYDASFNYGANISAARETVSKDMGEAGKLLYNAATSAGDSLMMSALTGGVNLGSSQATGTLSKFALKATENAIRALPMALGAAGNTYRSVIERGGSEEQARMMFGATMFAETVTESVSVGNIKDVFSKAAKGNSASTVKEFFKTILGDAMEEGTSEAMSELITTWSDDAIMKELSQRNMLVNKYRSEGMSPREAQEAADRDILNNILIAGLTGGLSGATSTAVSYTAGRVSSKSNQTNSGANISATKDAPGTKNNALGSTETDALGRPVIRTSEEQTTTPEITEENVEPPSEAVSALMTQSEETDPNVDQNGNNILLLQKSDGMDARGKATVVSSVLAVSEEYSDAAIAATQELGEIYGMDKTIEFLKKVTEEEALNENTAKSIIIAALYDGDARRTLDSMIDGSMPVTKEYLEGLDSAALRWDAQNPAAANAIQQKINESVLANAVVHSAETGAANGLQSQQAQVDTTAKNLEEAKNEQREEERRLEALGESLNDAAAQYTQNPTSQQLEALVTQLANDVVGQKKMVDQAKQTVANADSAHRNAKQQYNVAEAARLNEIREQETQRISDEAAAQTNVEPQTKENIVNNEGRIDNSPEAVVSKQEINRELTGGSTTEQQRMAAAENLSRKYGAGKAESLVKSIIAASMAYPNSDIQDINMLKDAIVHAALNDIGTLETSMYLHERIRDGMIGAQSLTSTAAYIVQRYQSHLNSNVEQSPAPRAENRTKLYARNVIARQSANTVTIEGMNDNSKIPEASPQAIAKNMAKELGIGDYIGTRKMNNVPKDVLGYYETRAKYISVRNKQAGNYAVTMHEMGHAIADKIGMTGTPQMVANLDPVFAANYKASELPGEAFAEFMWKYMISEQEARNFAGDAYVDAFERALVKNKLDKIVHKNALQLRMWVNSSANDQIGAVVKERSSGRTESFRNQMRKLFAGTLDSTLAAERVMKEIRKQTGDSEVDFDTDIRANALMKNTASKRAFNILTKNLTNAKWEVVGESLADVFENAGVEAKDMQLLERYMLALHSLDRDAKGKPVFDEHITKESRMEFIEQVKREHPEIVEAEKGFQKWRTQFLTEFLVKTGKISQDELDTFNAMYPHYVPTQRVKSNRNAASQHKGAKKFQIRSATGSTEDIWSPIDTFVTMVDSIVKDVSANNAALAWANAYEKYEGMGVFGRRITPDVKKVEVDTTALQAQVKEKLEGSIADDALQDILDMIGEKQSQFKVMAGKSNTPNTLSVQMPDGRIELFEMQDVELYKLLASVNENEGDPILDALGKLVKGMAMLTTGSNPVFAVRNFMRDFQNSVNYGSWASNYVTGFAKWMRAAWDVFRENGDFQKYQALGGGGWTRIDAGTKKGAAQYRSELFKGYNTSNVGRTAKFVGQKLWNTITLAKLNEVVEQTSRYAEFKYGKNDTTTTEGAQRAFIAAQDVTVDFSRSGNGRLGYAMKQLVPFFGASSQGVYRSARMFTEAEKSRAPIRFIKTVVNTGIMSVLANGILLKFLDDDEKKEYELLSDEMKSKHIYLPNFAPGIFGQQPLIRIPLAQDPLTYAIHGAFTNAVWSGNSDGPVLEWEAIANTIIDSLNPLGSGTVFQPLIGAFASNKNWYGGNIVPTNLSSLPGYAQYTEETPDAFVTLGRITNISPLKIQYLAEQYTGFLGQLAIPALSKDEFTGELGGLPAVISAIQKKFTSDPLVSNDVVSSFYDGFEEINGIKLVADAGKPLELRRGLTEAEVTAAYTEAKEMVSSNGILGQTKKEISNLYKEIDKINANETLSDEEKYVLTSDVRRKMIEQALVAQEAIGEYREKYITGVNLITRTVSPGLVAHIPDAYESLPDVFKADESKDYMQAAKSVWESTGDDNALPHPLEEFEKKNADGKKIKYHPKETGHWEEYEKVYQKYYKDYCNTNLKKLASDDEEVRLQVLKDAHSKAHSKAKEWYFDQPGVLE